MTGGRRRFDILGIMIFAMQDDQFFQTAGNVEFSTDEIAQVSRPQKRTFPGVAQLRFKNLARLIRSSPCGWRAPSSVVPAPPDLVEGDDRPGWHAVTWDGRDRRGQRAAKGIYFVRLWDGHAAQATRLVLVAR